MSGGKLIIVGCDDLKALPGILAGLRENATVPFSVISADRESDLISIAKSLQPSLVITCFSDNRSVIRDFDFYVGRPEIPLLCLTRSSEEQATCWSEQRVVITYPLEYIGKPEHLHAKIRSVLSRSQDLQVLLKPVDSVLADENERNLSRYVMELDQKKEALQKVKDRIEELFPVVDDPVRMELVSIANAIRSSSSDDRIWEDFKLYFEKVDPDFLTHISQKHPSLTSKDLKYCCYLKMNMSNDDIRNILGINQESVRTHKYRLKKKMALSREQDLWDYVRSVGRAKTSRSES